MPEDLHDEFAHTSSFIEEHASVGASVGDGVVGEALGANVGCLVSKQTIEICTIALG